MVHPRDLPSGSSTPSEVENARKRRNGALMECEGLFASFRQALLGEAQSLVDVAIAAIKQSDGAEDKSSSLGLDLQPTADTLTDALSARLDAIEAESTKRMESLRGECSAAFTAMDDGRVEFQEEHRKKVEVCQEQHRELHDSVGSLRSDLGSLRTSLNTTTLTGLDTSNAQRFTHELVERLSKILGNLEKQWTAFAPIVPEVGEEIDGTNVSDIRHFAMVMILTNRWPPSHAIPFKVDLMKLRNPSRRPSTANSRSRRRRR